MNYWCRCMVDGRTDDVYQQDSLCGCPMSVVVVCLSILSTRLKEKGQLSISRPESS